ncbi:uroporphyrinogen-III synthase [Bacillus sp. PS06]|uniref:uroporphyrinogen-III synthase n=1 Tax=Bacillus sp. PS06 TaxID=2764176 RepID=UPI0017859943|nr:uroporphyrinogen-III synthase [Bacillus sp. PS06]MBD8068867.1 uroporphyrinogen-III synthase [Bacillus sp. PS06]
MGERLPLSGTRILVTRGKDQANEFSTQIKELGGIPIEVPLIAFTYPESNADIREKVAKLDTYDWLIFTSKNGVDFFFEAMVVHQSALPKIAVVGTKTNEALMKKGYQADVIPTDFVGEGLTAALKPMIKPGERFLLARGNLSRSHIPTELQAAGGVVDDLIIYENRENESEKDRLIEILREKQVDVITFTSPSTVVNFLKLVEGHPWREWLKEVKIACIGPITENALIKAEIDVHVCPAVYTTKEMLSELVRFYEK